MSDWQELNSPLDNELAAKRFYELADHFLKKPSISRERKAYFVTYDDFEELQQKVNRLEHKLNQTFESPPPVELEAVLGEIISITQGFKENDGAYYKYGNRSLNIYVPLSKFSANILDKLSEIEINLSRKYPNISMEIEPVLCKDDLPEGVKKYR